MSDALTILQSCLVLAAPLILAAMGGYTSERGGVINIALEGKMLGGACAFFLVSVHTGDLRMGLAAGIATAVVLSLLHWLATQVLNVDQIISGMAVNALAFGGSNFANQTFADPSGGTLPPVPTNVLVGTALILPLLLALYTRSTRGGLRLLASGSDPVKARLAGIKPLYVRLLALVSTGIFCGLAGALIVGNSGQFSDGMTAGRGFIALAALILGGWRPIPAALAALAFGLVQAIQLQLQGTKLMGAQIPTEVWYALPYIVTVVALAGFMGKGSKAPAGLGKV